MILKSKGGIRNEQILHWDIKVEILNETKPPCSKISEYHNKPNTLKKKKSGFRNMPLHKSDIKYESNNKPKMILKPKGRLRNEHILYWETKVDFLRKLDHVVAQKVNSIIR